MMSRLRFWLPAFVALVALAGLAYGCGDGEEEATATPGRTGTAAPAVTGTAPAATPKPLSGKLEIFSWWTTGGEAAGLKALYGLYPSVCPGTVDIVNSTVAGGGGAQARQVLTTRMLGNDPPGSFQVHMGHELTDTWVATNYMEPLDFLFTQEGWTNSFPKGSPRHRLVRGQALRRAGEHPPRERALVQQVGLHRQQPAAAEDAR
jgi:glucose/mannose transport system substrate-binding protein